MGRDYEGMETIIGNAIRDTDFDIRISDSGLCLFEAHSPAGEDIPLERYLESEDACGALREVADWIKWEADMFDVDEHVELWVDSRGKNGVPSTVRELLDDAEAIQQMLDELAKALGR